MKKFSKKACACIGKLLPNHSHMATCVALGGGADF
ncbi:unknown [Clostridium sp. CAG:967]|nr:unknown [Clostridium sp. CAG:967]